MISAPQVSSRACAISEVANAPEPTKGRAIPLSLTEASACGQRHSKAAARVFGRECGKVRFVHTAQGCHVFAGVHDERRLTGLSSKRHRREVRAIRFDQD